MTESPMTEQEMRDLRETVTGLKDTVAALREEVTALRAAQDADEHDHEDDETGFPGWNGYHHSDAVQEVLSLEAYQRFWPENFMGDIASNDELHLATVVEITSLAGEYATHDALAAFARDWVNAYRMIRAGLLKTAFIRLDIAFGGAGAAMFATLEHDQILTSMLCTCSEKCGASLGDPLVYWRSDNGGLSNHIVEEYDDELVDMQVLTEGVRVTGIHFEAQRVQDQRPEGVVDLHAVRMRRSAAVRL